MWSSSRPSTRTRPSSAFWPATSRGIVRDANPRFVLFGHWENFFRSPSKPLQTLFAFDFGKLRDRMDALKTAAPPWSGDYWFAPPGALYVFPRSL